MHWYVCPESWSFVLRRYLPRLTLCSLVWEVAQLPLYTLWASPPERILFAVAHCTLGDVMIGTVALVIALMLNRAGRHANWPKARIVVLMIFLAVTYTLLSERSNLTQGNWAYSVWMPVLPWVEVGLAPVAQWIIVPLVTWWWANRRSHSVGQLK